MRAKVGIRLTVVSGKKEGTDWASTDRLTDKGTLLLYIHTVVDDEENVMHQQ